MKRMERNINDSAEEISLVLYASAMIVDELWHGKPSTEEVLRVAEMVLQRVRDREFR